MVQQWLAPPKKHQESLYYQNQTMNYASKKEKKHQMMYQKKNGINFDPPPTKNGFPWANRGYRYDETTSWSIPLSPTTPRCTPGTWWRWCLERCDRQTLIHPSLGPRLAHGKMKVLNPKNRVFPTIGGKPPKWMVKIMENPIKMDDLGGKPTILGNPQYMG